MKKSIIILLLFCGISHNFGQNVEGDSVNMLQLIFINSYFNDSTATYFENSAYFVIKRAENMTIYQKLKYACPRECKNPAFSVVRNIGRTAEYYPMPEPTYNEYGENIDLNYEERLESWKKYYIRKNQDYYKCSVCKHTFGESTLILTADSINEHIADSLKTKPGIVDTTRGITKSKDLFFIQPDIWTTPLNEIYKR